MIKDRTEALRAMRDLQADIKTRADELYSSDNHEATVLYIFEKAMNRALDTARGELYRLEQFERAQGFID